MVRAIRFMEEAIELFQALGGDEGKVFELIDQVYRAAPGEPRQEVGGVVLTLMLVGQANDINIGEAAYDELGNAYRRIDEIRDKVARKTKVSEGESTTASRYEFLRWIYAHIEADDVELIQMEFTAETGKEAPTI